MPDQKYAGGAHVVLYANGSPYADVGSITTRMTSPSEEIHGIDDLEPSELGPSYVRVSGSLELYYRVGGGGIEGAGLMPLPKDLPRARYLSLSLIDRVTGQIVFECRQAQIEDQTWAWRSKTLAQGVLSFKGLTWGSAASK